MQPFARFTEQFAIRERIPEPSSRTFGVAILLHINVESKSNHTGSKSREILISRNEIKFHL